MPGRPRARRVLATLGAAIVLGSILSAGQAGVANAMSTSDARDSIASKLNSWRVHTEHGTAALHNSRLDAATQYFSRGLAGYTLDPFEAASLFPTGSTATWSDTYTYSGSASSTAVSRAVAHFEADYAAAPASSAGQLVSDNHLSVGATTRSGTTYFAIQLAQFPSAIKSAAATPDPKISGTVGVGHKLTATSGVSTTSKTTVHYAWDVAGTIVGTDSKYYTPVLADGGKELAVIITVSTVGRDDTKRISSWKNVAKPPLTSTAPSVTGKRNLGQTLTVSPGTWGPGMVAITYQWLRDGAVISGAVDTQYTQLAADYGHLITVRVYGYEDGYTPSSVVVSTSTKTGHPLFSSIGTPALPLIVLTGTTVTAQTGTWAPGTPTFTYQWLKDGKAISGATHSTFAVPFSYLAHVLSVTVTATETGVVSASATSAGVLVG